MAGLHAMPECGVAAGKGADVDGLWEHCDGRAVMCSEQQAVRQSVPVCGEKRVGEHVKVPSVRRVCTVDRMPLSPVKNMKVGVKCLSSPQNPPLSLTATP